MKSSAAAQVDHKTLVLTSTRSLDQDTPEAVRHPVIVVGAEPVELSAAIDLAQQGVPVLLLGDDDRLSTGSPAICFAKRTLGIFDRLGCAQRMIDKGVTWNLGKVSFHDEPVYNFNLLPEAGHQRSSSGSRYFRLEHVRGDPGNDKPSLANELEKKQSFSII